ncbi:MAG TPA: cytochrome c oxidase assembly protein [Gaiellaceae bacterium]|nr:cytochrome c oxidase assembly protein [Gaiellaceae bacterium]
MGAWQLAPLPLAAAATACFAYGQGFLRLRTRRRSLARTGPAVAFGGGSAVALLAVCSPLDALGEDRLLTAHMAQHLLLGDVAPLLLVLGLRGPIAVFALPIALLKPLARRDALRRLLRLLLRPRVSFAVWVATVYGWHDPDLYGAAIAHPLLHDLEHASFLLAGLLVWVQIVDPTGRGRLTPGGRATFAASLLLAGMPLAEILIGSGPLYPHYTAIAHRPFGLTAAADQTKAGLLMMAEQAATLVPAAALLAWSHAERGAAHNPARRAPRVEAGRARRPAAPAEVGPPSSSSGHPAGGR